MKWATSVCSGWLIGSPHWLHKQKPISIPRQVPEPYQISSAIALVVSVLSTSMMSSRLRVLVLPITRTSGKSSGISILAWSDIDTAPHACSPERRRMMPLPSRLGKPLHLGSTPRTPREPEMLAHQTTFGKPLVNSVRATAKSNRHPQIPQMTQISGK